MSDNTNRDNEYNCIRDEMLSLMERAHALWKWGMVTILTFFGAAILILEKIETKYEKGSTVLHALLHSNFLMVVVIAELFYIVLTFIVVYSVLRLENGVDRLGAYLFVFHDSNFERDTNQTIGFHAWNRIEKYHKSKYSSKSTKKAPNRVIFSQALIWVYFVFFCCLFVSLAVARDILLQDGNDLIMPLLGICGAIALYIALCYAYRRGRSNMEWWNLRWFELHELSHDDITRVLNSVCTPPKDSLPTPQRTISRRTSDFLGRLRKRKR